MAELIEVLEAGPARAGPPPPGPRHNVPDQRTRFIGREDALADLARLLPARRVLTLNGIGGCGKTRLALQFAQHQLAEFPDGMWFVDLGPVTHADRVASTCAAVLGVRDEGDAPLVDRLVRQLAARRALLILDNCEHVLPGVVGLIDALLIGAPGTAILATSREALGIRGEQIYPVRSLSLPVTLDLDAVLGAESVRVFVDRARLVVPEFEVDAGNAVAVAEICRRLDGIALAIELAAARVTMLSAAQIAERLDDRFRLLTGGTRALPRHQTLAAAMDWSFEQLAPAAQRMLRQVSVFVGGWSLSAAADVAQTADEHDALTLLTALHDKSLLVVERPSSSNRPRYRLLETVRQYAVDRLNDSGEAVAARDRHVAHHIALAETAGPRLGGTEQAAWLDRLREEHENLIAALTWCSEGRGDQQAGLRLAAATSFYWIWNSVELGQRLALAVLACDHTAEDTPARAATLDGIARLSLSRGRYEESLAFSRQAVAVARRIGGPGSLAPALQNLVAALTILGHRDEARQCNEEVLALARQMDDPMLMSNLLNSIAESRRAAGDLDAAEQSYREALDLSRAHSGGLTMIVVLNNLIRVQVARGRLDDARRLAVECLPTVAGEKVGVDLLEATVGLAAASGEYELAARFWGAADRTLLGWGYRQQPVDLAHVTPLLAGARRALGDAAYTAAEAAGRALDLDAAMAELAAWLGRDDA
jgi:predicted ATPase